ncbi:MAG: T9SS type A sorting domain-containing protein [Bacteroidetes bacterium]|nr:T9SS type A sorting domain-containing protein [Bacteroidota bacterium]
MKNTKLLLLALFIFFLNPINSFTQIDWEKHPNNPIFSSDNATWASEVANPAVLFEEQLFKMWFSGYEIADGLSAIGYTESPDGINWTESNEPVIYPGDPGSWDLHKYPGCVLRVNDTLKMWYSGSINGGDIFSIGYGYFSEDSAKWILHPDPVLEKGLTGSWDAAFVARPSVYFDGMTYKMWYYGWVGGSFYNPASIGYATSENGINWTKDTLHNPVLSVGLVNTFYDTYAYGPAVLYYNNKFHMWFAGWDGTGTNPHRYIRIGYATSQNGFSWFVENNDDPVLDVGEPGEWDDNWVRFSSVIVNENKFKMWYDGKGEDRKIGYAYSEINTGINQQRSAFMVGLSPNPCKEFTNLHVNLDNKQIISIDLFGISGVKILGITRQELVLGQQEIKIDMHDLPAGVYFCILKTNEGMQTRKIIKL